ncbi:hypothetical protein E2562_009804 [Oryza meyeriana var. granulata]|uniref:Uncharacterized protein n=1 Tax=Oryza meyeriana var. granulata TaxID=110450 RepID=A0A6G1BTE2_9ORYZ|nr:hypothetical protein E2562_009804 [Oryza meyeriana var. granulata]
MNSASCRATQRTTCSRATAVGPLLSPVVPHVVAKLEEWLGAEIEEAHLLVGQNQRLAATHRAGGLRFAAQARPHRSRPCRCPGGRRPPSLRELEVSTQQCNTAMSVTLLESTGDKVERERMMSENRGKMIS